MPYPTLVKVLAVAAALGFSAAQAGADDYGIVRLGQPINRVGVQGADDYGIVQAPGQLKRRGTDGSGIA